MADLINWVIANIEGIIAVIAGVHVAALAVVNLTPTPKDNEALAKVYGVVETIAGLLTSKAKQ